MRKKILMVVCFLLIGSFCFAAPKVRIKDIAHVLEARENQIMGFGLVVGLRNTGDTQQTGFTKQALTNLLSKMGMAPQIDFKSRNVAAVMVTANLPAYIKIGQKLDVTVSSMGDATSLSGGTLLLTPLVGPDQEMYASAQGNIVASEDQIAPNLSPVRKSQSTGGRIPGGALVEKEVPVSLANKGFISIVLNNPDFTTSNRAADAIANAGFDASAQDASTIKVAIYDDADAVKIISRIENIFVTPDVVAKVVVNERTGTIVIGENVRISEAAVTAGNLNVTVGDVKLYSETGFVENDTLRSSTTAQIKKQSGKLVRVPNSAKLVDLVKALNAVKASPQELIAILQALKKVGSLNAELEVI
ncbi:MAG: flagellar P-ring protein precursor FlgI [Candidatus Saganbacteria bacterium]|uniref:Flagellar P-ring protein n=1 Tax=Candidatus Saganbacteria bacterium TaxID=2575572 RepID=A0A833L084_UNCSA|nr:MAG: flagellar P-ring protein precursor FlgI [Candidatus Saganbacteria bacterium]